jgi:hypothetical protein
MGPGRFPGHGSPAAALAISAFVVVCAVVGCTETQVLSRRGRFQPEPLPRPNRIVVYDFDTTHAEVKLDPSIPKEIARGRTPLGEARRQVALAAADVLAAALVDEILALGMPAERGKGSPIPKQGALIVDGQIGRIDEGSRAVRAAVGYGAGQSELRTLVHVYHVTERGRRRIGEFATVTQTPETVNAGGVTNGGAAKQTSDKTNVVVDAERTAKKAGDVLAELFVRQGWMSDGVR